MQIGIYLMGYMYMYYWNKDLSGDSKAKPLYSSIFLWFLKYEVPPVHNRYTSLSSLLSRFSGEDIIVNFCHFFAQTDHYGDFGSREIVPIISISKGDVMDLSYVKMCPDAAKSDHVDGNLQNFCHLGQF